MRAAREKIHPERAAVVSKAAVRASQLLDMKQAELASVLGLSTASVSRLATSNYTLDAKGKEYELAVLFVRMFRGLDALLGSNEEKARLWLRAHNSYLDGVPLQLIQSAEGLVHVIEYLDAMRGAL